MDEIIVKYLLGEASEEERKKVEDWRSTSDENKRIFEHFELIWTESKNLASQSVVDENAAWLRFKEKTIQAEPSNIVTFRPSRKLFSMKAAAAVLVLIFGVWIAYYLTTNSGMILVASNNLILIDTLPDGSVVTLNKNSSIKYSKIFAGKTRKLARYFNTKRICRCGLFIKLCTFY